uniref:Prolactin-induced protein n=1 Tax=Marmota marmota marmota TaxID=9994 RepID=A0A8C5Z7C5_MARMA
MRSLQLPLRAGPAALLLVLCLQLGFNKRNLREGFFPNQEIFTLKLKVQTELRECMVVKAHLQSNPQIEGSFNYKFTRCLCEDNPVTFFWDFQTNRTAKIAIVVDIINEKNICVEDISVVPNEANRYYTVRTLFIG